MVITIIINNYYYWPKPNYLLGKKPTHSTEGDYISWVLPGFMISKVISILIIKL